MGSREIEPPEGDAATSPEFEAFQLEVTSGLKVIEEAVSSCLRR